MQSTKKKRLLFVVGILCTAALGTLVFVASALRTPTPKPPVPAAASRPSSPAAKSQVAAKQREAATKNDAPKNPLVHQALNSPSTLGDLARMRGQKHLLEQEVRIEELQQRLRELKQPVPKKQELLLPDLAAPKNKEVPVSASVATPPKREPVVVSVQGIAGKLTATIRTSDGHSVTVSNGGSFAGGILHVTRKGVSIRRNGKLAAVPFE